VRINDVQPPSCDATQALPPRRNGGYCIHVSAGEPPWASFYTY
jgi:hypothetical protein